MRFKKSRLLFWPLRFSGFCSSLPKAGVLLELLEELALWFAVTGSTNSPRLFWYFFLSSFRSSSVSVELQSPWPPEVPKTKDDEDDDPGGELAERLRSGVRNAAAGLRDAAAASVRLLG